jgi:DNA-directed RNA polymerase specialized sigma subunit
MAYVRKTKDRPRLLAANLRRRAALIAAGLKPRELDVLHLRHVKKLSFDVIAAALQFSNSRAQQIHNAAFRKIFSPRFRPIAFLKTK